MMQLRERAVVVYTEPGEGYMLITGGGTRLPAPAGIMWDPTFLLNTCAPLFEGEGVIVIPHAWTSDAWQNLALTSGWRSSTVEDSPWVTFRQTGKPTIHVCRGAVAAADDRTPLFHEAQTPAERAYILESWHAASGFAFHGSPGVVGTEMLRASIVKGRQPQWIDTRVVVDGVELRDQGDLVWERKAPIEPGSIIHGYDLNAQYLAACTTLVAPWDGIAPSETPFDATRAGFWQVPIHDLPGVLFSDQVTWPVLESRFLDGGTIWLSTPVLEYLAKTWNCKPPVIQAMVARKSKVWLADWAHTMFDLRRRATDVATYQGPVYTPIVATAKRAANEAIGLMAREGGRCHNPALRSLVIDQARVNLLRKLDKVQPTGATVVRVNVDAVYVAVPPGDTCTPEQVAASIGFKLGLGLGMFKYIGATQEGSTT